MAYHLSKSAQTRNGFSMKTLSAGAVIMVSLLSAQLAAQRGALIRAGAGVFQPGNVVVPPLKNVVPPLGGGFPRLLRAHQNGSQFNLPVWGYPWGFGGDYGDFGDYGDYYGNGFQAQASPSVVVVMPQLQLPPPPLPPPPPVRPETREYQWPASTGDANEKAFSIVSKDHRVQSAIAVWVQGRFLCYTAPDGSNGRMAIDDVDREATRRVNAEKQLRLPLPAGS